MDANVNVVESNSHKDVIISVKCDIENSLDTVHLMVS